MKLELTFKSGATIAVDVDSYKYQCSQLGTKLSWETPDKNGRMERRKLVMADLDEIAAIVEVK